MKKLLIVLGFCLLFVSKNEAQILNSGFEQTNWDGSPQHWGTIFLIAILIDSNGVSHYDSLVYDHYLFFTSNDAHSGNHALGLGNIKNVTQQLVYGGVATLSTDTLGSSWAPMVSISSAPTNFSFYYKYLPAGPDTAQGLIELYDSSSNMVGSAVINLSGTTSTYTLASAPIVYNGPGFGVPSFANVSFRNAAPGTTPTFGTRLLVDDISIADVNGISQTLTGHGLQLFPNPATTALQVKAIAENNLLSIYDSNGNCLLKKEMPGAQLNLDISSLSCGTYFLQVNSITGEQPAIKFIKQ